LRLIKTVLVALPVLNLISCLHPWEDRTRLKGGAGYVILRSSSYPGLFEMNVSIQFFILRKPRFCDERESLSHPFDYQQVPKVPLAADMQGSYGPG
jgi:hypothetical protein